MSGKPTVAEADLSATISSAVDWEPGEATKLVRLLNRLPAHVDAKFPDGEAVLQQLAELLPKYGFEVTFQAPSKKPSVKYYCVALPGCLGILLVSMLGCMVIFASLSAWSIGGWEYVEEVWAGAQIGKGVVYYAMLAGLVIGGGIGAAISRLVFPLGWDDGA